MTPEQVSALSDAELNRAMLTSYMPYWQSDKDILKMVRRGKIDYLTDHNLTMPLVFKHGITAIKDNQGSFWVGTDIQAGDGFAIYMDNDVENNNPLRAICECLVLIGLANKKC